MRYISIALSAEGPTDEAFLWPIIYRTTLTLAANAVVGETPYFIKRGGNAERIERICALAGEFDVFVVHADASKAALARIGQTIVEPLRDGASADCGLATERIVGLITVREMESWALACPDAVAAALGYREWPNRIAMPWNPAQVEALADPKQMLNQAFASLLPRPFDRSLLHETLEAIANRIPLGTLMALPSYQAFHADLAACLTLLRAAP